MIKEIINTNYDYLNGKHVKQDNISVNSESLEDLFHDALLRIIEEYGSDSYISLDDLDRYIFNYMKNTRFKDNILESKKISFDAYTETEKE